MTEQDDLAQQHMTAARLAARAEIRDVRLLRSDAKLVRLPEPGRSLTYDVEFEPNVDWDETVPTSFVVRLGCRLDIDLATDPSSEASDGETDADEDSGGVDVALINFEYAALVECKMRDGDQPLREEELTAYATTTGWFALYPFIREYVYDTTGRFSLPALTLGVLSRSIPGPGDTEKAPSTSSSD